MSEPVNSSKGEGREYFSKEAATKNKPSFWQNVTVGSISGISAVFMIQPMIYFKNAAQSKNLQGSTNTLAKDLRKSPLRYYKGVGGFAASFAPTIAIQTAIHGIFSTWCDPFIAATAAGAASAMIVCPAEGVMNLQQKTSKSFLEITKHIYSSYGVFGFYRAFGATAIREGAFTGAYLAATPMIKEKIEGLEIGEGIAQVLAGTAAGTIAACLSQPFDTFKTQKQRDFTMQTPMRGVIFQTAAFRGIGWRIAMVATATTVMPFVQEKLNRIIEKK
jgi:hypothetical protein